jgi:hypothetical protein
MSIQLTAQEKAIIRDLYKDKSKKAYCTSAVPLTYRKWNKVHTVDDNTEIGTWPAWTTLKIVMVSRFDDCGLTDDLAAQTGYHCRVSWDSGDITDIRWEP